MKIVETRDGAVIEVLVKPRSQSFRALLEGNKIVVYCREEPFNGRVNKELIKELSRLFRKKVELVSGSTSKQKRLLVRNCSRAQIESLLAKE